MMKTISFDRMATADHYTKSPVLLPPALVDRPVTAGSYGEWRNPVRRRTTHTVRGRCIKMPLIPKCHSPIQNVTLMIKTSTA